MPAPVTILADWRAAFRSLDAACPWPGPRPLERDREEDQALLVGRDADEARFADDVLAHQLVILTGESGVGKSSLLNVGLVRRLRQEGFLPLVCYDWTNVDGVQDPELLVVDKLRADPPPGIDLDDTASKPLCSQLDRRYGEQVVLVLDQFEELIRYQPRLFERMLEWLVHVNGRYETHVVLSLRAEYTHRLRWLESHVRPFSVATYVLEPLRGEEIVEEIIRSADARSPGAIDDDAVQLLVGAWTHALETGGARPVEVGLLDLQASLYALNNRSGGGTVGAGQVQAMQADAFTADLPFFDLAMREAVRLKLERCQAACRDMSLPEQIDRVLVEGTMTMVQKIARQLSSAGYKLVREEWELGRSTLGRDLERLQGADAHASAEAIFRRLSAAANERQPDHDHPSQDLLTISREVVELELGEVSAGGSSPFLEELGIVPAPWVADPADLSSGPMFGMAPTAILIEELRRFSFALQWLRTASLVRASSPSHGHTMLSLIHDGFGPALEDWAREHRAGPAQALNLLAAAHGERYDWQSDRSDAPIHPEFDGGDGHVTVANVRWRDCQVSASFRRVVFLNCDLRGTRFELCGFRGVVFVNCLLDGASFGNCTIFGPVEEPTAEQAELPSFKVTVPQGAVDEIARYRGLIADTADLFSVTSGVPAVPWREAHGEGVEWERQPGGLTMYGGRLSSLTIRNCRFEDDAALAFRHIAGSSLDIVEQTGGRVDVYDSAIRGLTVTRPVEQSDPEAVASVDTDRLVLTFRSSVLTNTWFGDGLSGSARFSDCLVLQLCNLSERRDFEVEIVEGSGYHGLVNVEPPHDGSAPWTEFTLDSILDRGVVSRAGLRMDYRSTPARLELDQRARRHSERGSMEPKAGA